MLRDPSLIPLSHDHQHALAMCVLAEKALKAGEDPGPQAQKIVEQFNAEMRRHFEFEEAVLFPLLADMPLVAELELEHDSMRSRIHKIRLVPTRESILRFCALLRHHVRKEEALLFEEAQRRLTREQLDEIAARHRTMM